MKSLRIAILTLPLGLLTLMGCVGNGPKKTESTSLGKMAKAPADAGFLQNTRQYVFEGKRSGEGYFSPDGELMIFQSERSADNPFYQMYVRNLKTDVTTRVSPGYGKTTCGWIAPDKRWLIFSSTHHDKTSKAQQEKELASRAAGETRRYSWDYDPEYEIYRGDLKGQNLQNLTRTKGYDAEGSVSPDGRHIVFASNRQAYAQPLSAEDAAIFARDPSYFMDLYIMDSDGRNVRQLTRTPGYDGGPFFSPDGERVVWRRFSPDGHSAEIFTARVDGSDEKQLTNLKAMSWAPFYHPSGDYIVFTSSVYGHQNFELFVVDASGSQKSVRVTSWEGFDGLPVFTPNGAQLTWNRKISSQESQIMIAEWDDSVARSFLQLSAPPPKANQLRPEITQADLKTHVQYLASKDLKGRATGSPEEKAMVQTLSRYFRDLGLSPVNGRDYEQVFSFAKAATLGMANELTLMKTSKKGLTQHRLAINKDWRPLSISKSGEIPASPVAFAGYGLKVPKSSTMAAYDSYEGLDVKDKWVIVLRFLPEKVSSERSLYLQRYASLENKVIVARDLGARGVIFINGPTANAKNDLISFSGSATNMGLPVISITDEQVEDFFELAQRDLKTVQKALDEEKPTPGFDIEAVKFSAAIQIRSSFGEGRNVFGLLRVPGAKHTLIIGAHGDHLGDAPHSDSLRTSQDGDPIHYGADDNASGVAAVLELAHEFKKLSRESGHGLKQNILFAIWSGEELGVLGSSYFTRQLKRSGLRPSAYINMDMIGRWKNAPQTQNLEPLSVQGVGSSPKWREILEGVSTEAPLNLQEDPYLPTDAMPFYMAKVPVVSFFTGVHTDYHSPRDTADKINYDGLQKITAMVAKLARKVVANDAALPYAEVQRTSSGERRGFRIYLGTIPDYAQQSQNGVVLSGVISNGPAEKAGLRGGDVIVEFSNKKIANIYDYVFALETLRPNEPTKIVVLRGGQRREIDITPVAKE